MQGEGIRVDDTKPAIREPARHVSTNRRGAVVAALMLAMALAMATFILGGGAATSSLPAWIHHALFWATLLVQARTLWIEKGVLEANEKLMADIDRRLARVPAG